MLVYRTTYLSCFNCSLNIRRANIDGWRSYSAAINGTSSTYFWRSHAPSSWACDAPMDVSWPASMSRGIKYINMANKSKYFLPVQNSLQLLKWTSHSAIQMCYVIYRYSFHWAPYLRNNFQAKPCDCHLQWLCTVDHHRLQLHHFQAKCFQEHSAGNTTQLELFWWPLLEFDHHV